MPPELSKAEKRFLKLIKSGGGDKELAVLDEIMALEAKVDDLKKSTPDLNGALIQLKGATGDKGAKGDKGERGEKGDTGAQGMQGIQGIKGERGDKGDAGINGTNGTNGTNGIDGKDGSPDTVNIIRDKLELLSGDARLKAEAISGLEEFIKKLIPEQRLGGGTSAIGVKSALGNIVQTVTPTGAINDVNKAYTVPSDIHAIFSFSINGQVIPRSDYSVAGRTITMVTALPAALSGTAYELVYV